MHWARRVFLHLLALVLLASLLGVAFTISGNQNLRHPQKIETWLSQSKLYDRFVKEITNQAKKTAGDNSGSSGVSLNDAAVQQAAQNAFPPHLLQQSVNTFIDSNYAWLDGKTTTPDFKIDLTQAKATFAQQVGQYVQMHLATLPACTPAQQAQLQAQGLQNIDPLTIVCRPAGLDPKTEGDEVTKDIASSGDFLSNPVITASTINPHKNGQSKPYYQKIAKAPKLYQLSSKLPFILVGLTVLIAAGIIALTRPRRQGWRKVGIVLLEAGIILVISRLLANTVFHQLENRVFNNSNNGPLQQSLTDFVHRVQIAFVKTDLLVGIVFIVLAAIILGWLLATRRKKVTSTSGKPPAAAKPAQSPTSIATTDETASPHAPTGVPPLKKKPRPPRLIQ